METGTGETYTYIRTIMELNKRYGWLKFVIVVPSVAIREGFSESLQDHVKSLSDGVWQNNHAILSTILHV